MAAAPDTTPEQRMRDAYSQLLEHTGRPAHPSFGIDQLDPTARSSTLRNGKTVSAELRSLENAISYHSIEGLLIGLTPLGMADLAFAMLQFLAGDHGRLPDGITLADLDPWKELRPFMETEAPFGTYQEECGRAGWHLGRVLAHLDGEEVAG